MGKISLYTELTRVDPHAFNVLALSGKNYKRDLEFLFLQTVVDRFSGSSYKDEFWSTSGVATSHHPWRTDFVGGAGTPSNQTSVADHPGIIRFAQNGANTGGAHYIDYPTSILIAGEEQTELIFQMPTTTAVVIRFGFGDNFANAAAPIDGIWIDIAGTTVSGKTRNNSIESTTGTTFALSATTWYRAKIIVNADATRVDFTLYSAAGAVLWTDFLTTNIPKSTGRETSHGVHAYKTTAGTAALIDLDLMSLRLPKTLTR